MLPYMFLSFLVSWFGWLLFILVFLCCLKYLGVFSFCTRLIERIKGSRADKTENSAPDGQKHE